MDYVGGCQAESADRGVVCRAGPSGVSVRDRLRGLTVEDERLLRLLGRHLGSLASGDLGRWYITASWQRPPTPTVPWPAARTAGVVGVDFNADHLACYRHGNPVGGPHRFSFDLSGTADHRDAQIRHALTRLLHWAEQTDVTAIAVEDLDFSTEKTR
ncbi:hypothetical protein F4560_005173 [Saccharothrix ecbatanensis]|uniref:Transposase n=1 Tax=Saccharothrix ecbatanensis TaxID=1105145 RepID=A0A7W9M2W3_9PSEU|nr:hypothetical protein [Saccharothrix ecbatanensis]MBB5805405.1 hypothetical protein [Saccharothrix ecbatanensis]